MAEKNVRDRARDIAHELTPRCRGGEWIGSDGQRYHSQACDRLTDALETFALSEMERCVSAMANQTETRQSNG